MEETLVIMEETLVIMEDAKIKNIDLINPRRIW